MQNLTRFRRAGEALEKVGIRAFTPPPVCCGSCASAGADPVDEPLVWVFRSDNTLNGYSFWNKADSAPNDGYVFYDRKSIDFDEFVATVSAALRAVGFDVTAPMDERTAFEVTLRDEDDSTTFSYS